MRRLHGIALCSATALLLSSTLPTAQAVPELPTAPSGPSCPTTGLPDQTNITTDGQVQQAYFQNDLRLGPKDLPKPKSGVIGELLDKYNRYQAMGPKQFIDCYWAVNAISPMTGKVVTGWRYPPNDGFAEGSRKSTTLTPGTKLEQFGGPTGKFLAPENTPYSNIAIPPSNLDTFTNKYPFNYHLFLVCKGTGFPAEEGRIAPWFQQPGGGIQYFLGNNGADKNQIGKLTGDLPGGPQPPVLKDITDPTTPAC